MRFYGILVPVWLFLCSSLLTAAETPVLGEFFLDEFRLRDGIGRTLWKLDAEEEVTVAYLGGSITAANGWRPKTITWLKKTWPKATVKEVNAAIGGTGSDLGVFRLEHDVLRHKPDLLFVEFAVNDGGASPENIWRGMEGIVRQTWRADPKTDIVFVYTISEALAGPPREGRCNRSMAAMEQLAEFYGIPSVNFAVPVLNMEKAGKLLFKGESAPEGVVLFSHDSVHPLDAGHEIYAASVKEFFRRAKAADFPSVDHVAKLDHHFVDDNWESAKLVPITEPMLHGDWKHLDAADHLQKSFGGRLGSIWYSETPGSRLTFRFKGSQAKIYDLLGPDGGQVVVTVDDQRNEKPIPRFDSYCTYHRLATLWLADGLDPTEIHTISVEVHPDQPSRQPVAFRLSDPEKELAEPKFQGTKVWFGKIMLLGDIVE